MSVYRPHLSLESSPTLFQFLQSRAPIRIVKGPFGSGKTVACCVGVYMHALEQLPGPDGVRYFKAAVVRNTKPELKSTTCSSWEAMYPVDKVGSRITYGSPIAQRIAVRPRDFVWVRPPDFEQVETDEGPIWVCRDAGAYRGEPGIDLRVEFLGLDDPKDAKKLLSAEYSMFYFNELSEIRKQIVDMADLRHGRYPSWEQGGVPCSWSGIIADTNEPDDVHWLHTFEDDTRDDPAVEVYVQPPALLDSHNEEAGSFRHAGHYFRVNRASENIANLPGGYYSQRLRGKDLPWVRRYLQGRRVFLQDGRPCVPGYDDESMSDEFGLLPSAPLLFGYDIGSGTLHPACVIGQRHPRGPMLIHAEVCGDGIGLDNLTYMVNTLGASLFPSVWGDLITNGSEGWADPSGATKDEIFEQVGIEFLRARGLPARECDTNDPRLRVEAIQQATERRIEGRPGLLVHKRCTMVRAGLGGRWYYRTQQSSGETLHHQQPVKNEFSHPCDALGYLMLGSGGLRMLQGRAAAAQHRGAVYTGRVKVDPYGVLNVKR